MEDVKMNEIIHIVAIVLVIAYAVFSVWFIWNRQSLLTSVGASSGLICGGLVIVPIAEAIATFICYGIIVAIILAFLGAFGD